MQYPFQLLLVPREVRSLRLRVPSGFALRESSRGKGARKAMSSMLMTMNPTTIARLSAGLSWRSRGATAVRTGGYVAFHAMGPACGGVGEQRKGSRVSASGEAV